VNDKKFEKTVEAIRKLPAPQRVSRVEALRKEMGEFGLKPAQESKLDRITEVALA
jgi:hypothetical protein